MDYREDVWKFNDRVPRAKGERRVVYLDRSDVDASMFAAPPKLQSTFDSGKGVRIQVGFSKSP